MRRNLAGNLVDHFLASCFLILYDRVRMANLKSDDWRENMKERMEKEKAEKEA